MKLKLFIVCLILLQSVYGQVTFIVNELPENHDYNKDIYISGNFEGWSGGQEDYKLKKEDKTYSITLPITQEIIQYKFTMGSWDTVERDAEGNNTDNRIDKLTQEKHTIVVKIVNWDKGESNTPTSTASKNVTVLSETFDLPELNRKRRVWLYLPPDYNDTDEQYPVLYMHDGQNVFDRLTSYAGEWGVDETLNKLFRLYNFKLIVVAIDNGGDKRMNEYSAWDNQRFGKGEGKAYINFIANTLKPYIDTNFRTKKDAENTGIMGSSMGGLISHYAALQHPDVFGKAGVFSPSFWYAQEAFDLASNKSEVSNLSLYFLVGAREGDSMVPDMIRMIELMKSEGFPEKNLKQKVVDEGIHNEKFWKDEFEEAIMWLFPKAIQQREFVSAELNNDNQLIVKVSDGNYQIQYYSPDIIETNFIPKDETLKMNSHAVVLKPEEVDITAAITEDNSMFSTEGISVVIDHQPFNISYVYNDKEVISEKNGYRKIDGHETLQFNLTEDEILYGGGARALGMNRRGHRLKLYNRAHYGYETESELMNYTMPIVVSSKKYMIHFDNAPIGYLDLDSKGENTLSYETISGRKTYQVVVGDSWEDLNDNYTDLTGKQPMLPRWALGNFSSRFGYHSQWETEKTIEEFKKYNIPVDAIILDLYWFGKDIQGTMGNLEVYRDSFPDFEGMVNRLKQKGVKTIPITEPFILTTSKRWNEAVENQILATDSTGQPARYDFYFGNTGIIDIYKKEAENWFWNIYKDLADKGVAGVWGDLGEPEVHPSWVQHHTGMADEVHNTYGHDWARLVFEGYARDFPEQRPFILMRAGYSGSQRYGMIPWSGDVNRTWGGLKSQTEIALQMGMQGLAYMHSDLGGFAGANLNDELYTRWLQYGVFQPIFRPHAQEEVPSEPVFRGPRTRELAKKSIELRYQLLPYNYNLVFENSQKGTPLMRPLFYEEASNKTFNEASTYFWGNDFLVSPIMTAGATEKEVYFPTNATWFNFYTDEVMKGGQTKLIPTKEESIPTYVRAGAFIPVVDVVQSTEDYTLSAFDLHYYHHTSVTTSTRSLYNDDGTTKDAYAKGLYELLVFDANIVDDTLIVELEAEIGNNYSSEKKNINLVLHNIDTEPVRVKVGTRKFKKFNYNNEKRTLTIPLNWNTSKALELKITLKK